MHPRIEPSQTTTEGLGLGATTVREIVSGFSTTRLTVPPGYHCTNDMAKLVNGHHRKPANRQQSKHKYKLMDTLYQEKTQLTATRLISVCSVI